MTVSLILNEVDADSVVCDWVAEAARTDASQLREEPRFPLLTPATITRDGLDVYAMCRDISKKGIGVVQSGGKPVMGACTLSISLHQQIVYLDVDLSWRKEIGAGWWASGGNMCFASIDYASLMMLRMSNALDRRLHKRYPFCQLFSVYPNLELEDGCVGVQNLPPEQGSFAVSLDVSMGGIRLMCQNPLESNSEYIYLEIRESARSSSLIRGEVVSRQELGNGYFVIGMQYA